MQYLCLVHSESDPLSSLSEKEGRTLIEESLAYDDELRRRGHFVAAAALQEPETATSLRVRNGKLSVSDGPFTETKEYIGGFILIEARDLNEAIQVASKIPSARYGRIELRPTWDLAAALTSMRPGGGFEGA